MNDLISRQAAIDAICAVCGNDCDKSEFVYNAPQDEQVIMCPEHYVLSTLPPAVQPTQAEIQKAYKLGKMDAQDEIVRCKDCKHHSHDAEYGRDWCNQTSGVLRVKPDDFCSRAERREHGFD